MQRLHFQPAVDQFSISVRILFQLTFFHLLPYLEQYYHTIQKYLKFREYQYQLILVILGIPETVII